MNRSEREDWIATRLAKVRAEIDAAAADCGRRPQDVHLVAVTKNFPAEDAALAYRNGATLLGENRVQELLLKADRLAEAGLAPEWHLIGTLQKNKVRHVVGRVALIHSADTMALLREISARSVQQDVVSDVLLQVNVSGEDAKHGFEPRELPSAIAGTMALPGIRLRGLMTMAPFSEDPETSRPVFMTLFDLHAKARELLPPVSAAVFDVLSMGMSQDFRVAIACGATHIRVGTAIFGERIYGN